MASFSFLEFERETSMLFTSLPQFEQIQFPLYQQTTIPSVFPPAYVIIKCIEENKVSNYKKYAVTHQYYVNKNGRRAHSPTTIVLSNNLTIYQLLNNNYIIVKGTKTSILHLLEFLLYNKILMFSYHNINILKFAKDNNIKYSNTWLKNSSDSFGHFKKSQSNINILNKIKSGSKITSIAYDDNFANFSLTVRINCNSNIYISKSIPEEDEFIVFREIMKKLIMYVIPAQNN